MQITEYKEKVDKLHEEYIAAKSALGLEVAKANRIYKKGDTVDTSWNTIIVDKMVWGTTREGKIYNKYIGYVLTQKGVLRKDGQRDYLYQEVNK